MAEALRILLVRMDKIGDLVLSLPVDQAIPERSATITWLISQGTEFVVKQASPPRQYRSQAKNFSWTNLLALIKWLKRRQFGAAVVLYAPWWIGLALWLARVPARVGRLSQWHSYLFFNFGVRQSRKLGESHETSANLELLRRGFDLVPGAPRLNPDVEIEPLRLIAPSISLKNFQLSDAYVVVHAGMAGSALNWPTHCYAEIILTLAQRYQIVMTGTAMDRRYLEPLKQHLGSQTNVLWLDGRLSSDELLATLANAKAVVAPSTGVLHLAAALGTPCVGLYSPIPVQRPTRWGARGPHVHNLVSPVAADEAERDPEAAMAAITPREVLLALGAMGLQS